MSTTIKAVYEDGVFKPKEDVSLAEHAEVDVVIPTDRPPAFDADDPTGWKAIDRLIGAGEGPADLATNHDTYIYDDPAE